MNDFIERIKAIFQEGWETLKNATINGLRIVREITVTIWNHLVDWINNIATEMYDIIEVFAQRFGNIVSHTAVFAREVAYDVVEIVYRVVVAKKNAKTGQTEWIDLPAYTVRSHPPKWLQEEMRNSNGEHNITKQVLSQEQNVLTQEFTRGCL